MPTSRPLRPDRLHLDRAVTRLPLSRVAVLIPTYNERASLPQLVRHVRATVPRVDVVVLDDNSPDGTGAVADELAAVDPQVHVLHRDHKEGLGKAYLAGFQWAMEHGYDAVVEMDADGSHRPEHLADLLAAAENADLVIGSRWVRGGEVVNWPLHRKALSVGANQYTRIMLGMPVRDATAGYRVYRTSALRQIGLDEIQSHGYCFQIDLTWKAVRAGLTVVEVPIIFVERRVGDSKMSSDVIAESLRNVTVWGARRWARHLRATVARARGRGARWHTLES